VQTTLLGLAIAFIIALIAALIGPYFIDWNQFRPQFEAEATRVIGAPVHVGGELHARLLPAPSLRLRSVVVDAANDLGKVRADKLDVEFSLGSLMRGEWRATELTINGMALDLGLDSRGRIDWPASTGKFNLGTLSIDRLNLTGRIALHDAASRGTLELNDIAFSGDVRSLAGSVRGDGNFTLSGLRYPFRVSSGQTADGSGTRVHLNIDPGARALAVDLEGVLGFEARAPRFEGALVLAVPPGLKAAGDVPIMPWRIAAKVKADPSAARLEQLEASYGPEDSALKFAGAGDVRLGASPLLHAELSARQLDADRFAAKDNNAPQPMRLLPGFRALLAAVPQLPIPAQIALGAEQIMLGGRPVQNLAANLHVDAGTWTIDQLDFRAPGATQVGFSGTSAQTAPSAGLTGALKVESSDPDTLMAWLQGRGEIAYRSQKPLRLSGNVSVASHRVAIEAMQAEIDGNTVDGRLAISYPAGGGSRFEAELKAERLDLDAATPVARSLAGPQAEWPAEGKISLDIGRAVSSGQELRPLVASLHYGPNMISLERLKIGQPHSVMLDGGGHFDRVNSTGKLTLDLTAASPGRLATLISSFSPPSASRLNALGTGPGPAHAKLSLDLNRYKGTPADRATALAVLDFDTPQLRGHANMTATPRIADIRSIDIDALSRNDIGIEGKLSSEQGRALIALLGLDRSIAVGEGPAQFEGSANGAWRAPLRLKARIRGAGLDADAEGSAEPWAQLPKASINLNVRSASLAPLFDLKPSDTLAQNISLSSRVSLIGNKLTFDDLDSAMPGSRLRGNLTLTLDEERSVEGEVGLDTLDLAPAFALAIGAAGHEPNEPLGSGLLGWRGRIAFQALRGGLPGGGELRPVSGMVKSDGQSVTFDDLKGGIGGGEATANIDARQSAAGIALNARVELRGVDGAALRYRGLTMPPGRTSMQMTLASQGRSASALVGALSGSGTLMLDSARIAGLDPRAFDVAIRASDNGKATDDLRLRQIVEPALSAGALSVKSAQVPFSIRDGRLRISATTLDAEGARAIVSGGYDIPAEQADLRAILAPTAAAVANSHPEIQIFAAGSPDALNRTIDVTALSSWLAVRAIDRETRRLDAIERGAPLPPSPASIPPLSAVQPSSGAQDAVQPDQPPSEGPMPGGETRRHPTKPAVSAPHPPPARQNPDVTSAESPVVSQQVAPLPPPIEVRPPPGAGARPKARPPLVLTPPAATPARPAF
jgi:uncharacterized protein involved in outer membrane biogenesis